MPEFLLWQWRSVMLDAATKAIVLFLAAGAAALGLRRASADFRHLVWQLTLGSFLALPLLSLLLPAWQIPVSRRLLPAAWGTRWASPSGAPPLAPPDAGSSRQDAGVEAASQGIAGVRMSVRIADGRAWSPSPEGGLAPVHLLRGYPRHSPGDRSYPQGPLHPRANLAAPPSSGVTSAAAAPERAGDLWLWLAGVAVLLARAWGGVVQLRRIRRRCRQVTAAPVLALASELACEMGLQRPVTLLHGLLDGPPAVPMTWGFRRPVVLLPTGFAAWPEGRQRAVLLHELAHVRRGDWLVQLLASLACALYWFHPLVWWSARRLRMESEQACDDQVLIAGVRASDYATHLLEVVRASNRSRGGLRAAVSMARGPLIERRLRAILDSRRRGMLPRRASSLALVATVGLLPLLAAARVTARTPRLRSGSVRTAALASPIHRRAAAGTAWVEICRITESRLIRAPRPSVPGETTLSSVALEPARPLSSPQPAASKPTSLHSALPAPAASPAQRATAAASQESWPTAGGPATGSSVVRVQRVYPVVAGAGKTVTETTAAVRVRVRPAVRIGLADFHVRPALQGLGVRIRVRPAGAIVLAAKREAADRPAAPSAAPNLADKDLSGANLAGRDLSGKDLSGKDLSGANLKGAKLTDANLSHTDLSGANLANADLSHAKMTGTDLSGANLQGARLIGIDLSGVDCSGANLAGVEAAELTFKHSDLSGADLKGIRLEGRDLSGSDFSGSNLSGARLAGANLTKADFSGANLGDADLSHARLTNADLSGANLNGTKLDGADLTGADVSGTKLDRSKSE